MKRQWVVLWSLWAARLVRQPTAPVAVTSGLLRGEVAPDGSHARYLAVPYATHPANRFQAPEPEPVWKGVYDGFEENIRCLQRFSKTWITGREGCLTLNVYTPLSVAPDRRLPVMFFVHGGGFRDGSSSPFIYGPEYLVKHDVILVVINYRLEILGFLCLGIPEAPGNVGLKDQVQALNWVKKNIHAFGGDPDNITIFGESAGSASVLYHLMSPMSKGLFKRAIMQSASALAPWSFQFEPLKAAMYLAKQLGHETEDPHELYAIINKETSFDLLNTRIPRKHGDIILSENVFVPCAEREIPGVDPFITNAPYNLLSNGKYNKVPIMIGYNDYEGYMFFGKENDTTIPQINFVDSLPRDLMFSDVEGKELIGKRLRDLYMGDRNVTKDAIFELSKYEGDSGIVFPVIATIDLLARTMTYPVYAYKFCHNGWMNLMKLIFGFYTYPGATHADELFYMFKFKVTLPMYFLETAMIDRISAMWTNFAKYGDPTPRPTPSLPTKWNPVSGRYQEILIINNDFGTGALWDDDHIRFWNETYSKHRRKT